MHRDEAKIATSRYYDVVNFARRVTAPGLYSWGFNDETCPPTSMYAAYNVITAPKRLMLAYDTGHRSTQEQVDDVNDWLATSSRAAARHQPAGASSASRESDGPILDSVRGSATIRPSAKPARAGRPRSHPAMSSMTPGQQFGRYVIRAKLGAGGMGEVFLAEDTQLRRRVAMKLLPPDRDRSARASGVWSARRARRRRSIIRTSAPSTKSPKTTAARSSSCSTSRARHSRRGCAAAPLDLHESSGDRRADRRCA